jgi:hypothetical protein
VDVRGRAELLLLLDARLEEIGVHIPGRQHHRFAVDVAHLHILRAFADALGGLENGHLVFRRVAAGVFEEVDAVVGLVGAVHDEIEVAIAIEVHRQRPGPQTNAEIDDEAGVVVLERRQAFGGKRAGIKRGEEEELEGLHGWKNDHRDKVPHTPHLHADQARAMAAALMRKHAFVGLPWRWWHRRPGCDWTDAWPSAGRGSPHEVTALHDRPLWRGELPTALGLGSRGSFDDLGNGQCRMCSASFMHVDTATKRCLPVCDMPRSVPPPSSESTSAAAGSCSALFQPSA